MQVGTFAIGCLMGILFLPKESAKVQIVYIYCLIDPRNNQIRYVGKSKSPEKRYKSHLNEAISNLGINPYKNRWIRKLLSNNLKPILKIIEVIDDDKWEDREIYWIELFRSKGFRLTNITSGGRGEFSPLARKNLKEKILGKPKSEETKRKLSEINKGKTLSSETKKKISEKLKGSNNPFYGKKHPKEIMDIIVKANLGLKKSIETKEKLSKSLKGKIVTEETKEKMRKAQQISKPFLGKHHTLESRKKIGEASKSRKRVLSYQITCARKNNNITLEKELQEKYFLLVREYRN